MAFKSLGDYREYHRIRMQKVYEDRVAKGLTVRGTTRVRIFRSGLPAPAKPQKPYSMTRLDKIALQDPSIREGRDSEGKALAKEKKIEID